MRGAQRRMILSAGKYVSYGLYRFRIFSRLDIDELCDEVHDRRQYLPTRHRHRFESNLYNLRSGAAAVRPLNRDLHGYRRGYAHILEHFPKNSNHEGWNSTLSADSLLGRRSEGPSRWPWVEYGRRGLVTITAQTNVGALKAVIN